VNELGFSFNTTSKSEITVDRLPSAWIDRLPVYLPTRELLTLSPGFVSLYETTHLPFEETWRDTSLLLDAPLARGPRERRIRELLNPLEDAMNGKVELDRAGRFYLNTQGVSMEMHLVAEGLRKLAMVARLIATGSLVDKGFLFWDEPEANLNPKILRELDILLHAEEFSTVSTRFFGLHRKEDGIDVLQGETVDDIGEIAALQEELSQSDRYLAVESS
jgi:hypothetical protein